MVRLTWPGQDLDRPVDAGLAAGHQPVQVGPADQREPRAERHRGHNVRAGHDARVQQNLG